MVVMDTVSDVNVQKNFSDYYASIKNGGKALIITCVGVPEVVMLSIKDYEAITENNSQFENTKSKKLRAYEDMEKMKQLSPFPKDYDYDAIREEAFTEKYGSFN